MISYDRYENKIKKFAKFRSVLKRFRFLLLAIFALIVAAIATLLALKGSFSGEIKIASSVYGDGYADPEGVTAFMSAVSYEYRKEGGEWSSQKPYKAGKYNVRAVSDKTVGKGYGKVASFEIAPREAEFKIESDSVEYGGVPTEISCGLLAGDSLDKSALLFLYDDYVSERTGVDLDESSVKIMNGGDDRSGCYTVKHEKKELEITKRNIDVSLEKQSFIYSGTAVSYAGIPSESTVVRLANGDEIRFGSVGLMQNGENIESAVSVGAYQALPQEFRIYKNIDGREIDVTCQYQSNTTAVSFSIKKREITVQTASAEKEYDGTPLKKADGFTVTGLVAGDRLIILKSTEITNALSGDNLVASYEITNDSGADLKKNYEIDWQYGLLTVKKRKITVSSNSETYIYNGSAQGNAQISITDKDNLFEVGEVLEVASKTTVGTIDNSVDFVIWNKLTNQTDIKSNFEITEKWGTLTITPRDITITIANAEKEYDGYALITSATDGSENVKVTAGTLGNGDELRNGTLFELTNVHKESGEVAGVSNLSEYKIFSWDGGDRTNCYHIKYERGTLTVLPRHITLLSNSNSFVYDGQPHSDGGYTVYEEGREVSLIAGNSVVLQGDAPAFTNVWDTKNASENNVCAYSVSTENYVIDKINYGTVKILARSLTVTTNSGRFVYDGQPHSDSGYTAKHNGKEGLIGEDKLIPVSWATVVNVIDSTINECAYTVPNENYTIEQPIDFGMLLVRPRPIIVETDSAEKVYDGTPLSSNRYVKTYYRNESDFKLYDGLLNGDTLTLSRSYSIKNVYESGENQCEFSASENSNYFIEDYIYGKLTITSRPITVVTGSAEKLYDGTPLACDDAPADTYYTDQDGVKQAGLLNGAELRPKDRFSITNVSESSANNNACTFSEPNGNYKIIGYDNGTLTVTPRHISLLTNSHSFVYDGQPHLDGGYTILYGGFIISSLIEGNEIILQGSAPAFTNVWDTKNVYENNICAYSVNTENYVIDSVAYGTITIKPRPITVMTNSNTFIYNAEKHSDSGYTTAYGEESGLLGDDKLTVVTFASVLNVWDTAENNNVCAYSAPNENYEIAAMIYGKLTVSPRPIRVVTASAEKVYDGTPLMKNEYTDTFFIDDGAVKGAGLLGTDTLSLLYGVAITNVREVFERNNQCTFTVPNENYTIVGYDCGTLTITPRTLHVVTGSDEKVYDATPLSKDDEPEETYYKDREGKILAGLLNGDALIPKDRFSITNVRETKAGNNACTFLEPNTNYEIVEYINGTLTITKRPLYIQVSDVHAVYGEEPVYPSGFNNFANVETCGFVGGETACVSVEFGLKGDRIPVRWEDGKIVGYANVVRFIGMAADFNTDLGNYELTIENGTLYIDRRVITIEMKDAETYYGEDIYTADGKSAVYPAGKGNAGASMHDDYSKAGLLEGDMLEVMNVRYMAAPLLNPDDDRELITDGTFVTPKNAAIYYIKPYEVTIYYPDGSTEVTTDEEDGDCQGNYQVQYFIVGLFTIMPRPIEITLNEIETKYFDGETRIYSAGGEKIILGRAEAGKEHLLKKPDALAYGEQLEVKVKFDADPILFGDYFYSFDGDNSNILTSDGDIIYKGIKNYAYICVDGNFAITKRPVTIQMLDITAVYGEPYDFTGTQVADEVYKVVSELGFVRGYLYDIHRIFDCGERAPVGAYPFTCTPLGVNFSPSGYGNIIDSYDITVLPGTLKITPKEATVTVSQKSVLYGEPYNGFNTQEISALAYDETMTLALEYYSGGVVITPRNAGFYDVQITPVLSAGEEGLKNYTITYLNAEKEAPDNVIENGLFIEGLQIKKLPLTVTVAPKTVVYGEKIGENFVSCSPALPYADEELSVVLICRKNGAEVQPKYADTYEMVIGELLINGSAEGMNNYDVSRTDSLKHGTLTVTPRAITVKLDSLDLIYGDPVQYEGGNNGTNYTTITDRMLVYGDALLIAPDFGLSETSETRPDAGKYSIGLKSMRVLFEGNERVGGYLVADSYIVKVEAGTLTVNKRAIELTLNEIASAYYDGEEHNYVAGGETIGGAGMAEGETLKVAVKYYLGTGAAASEIAKANTYRYEFDPENSSVENGGLKGIDNYSITAESRNCTILQRSIGVYLLTLDDSVYGTTVSYPNRSGNYHRIAALMPSDYGLAAGEELQISVFFRNVKTGAEYDNGSGLPAGEYAVLPLDGDGRTITGGKYPDANNYQFTFFNSSFSVAKRSIVVTASDVTADYGETPTYSMTEKNYASIGGDGLAEGDSLTVRGVDIRMPQNAFVGEYPNAVEITAVHIENDGINVAENYSIKTVNGKLSVERREVKIVTATNTFVYDGDAHSDGGFTAVYLKNPAASGFVYGDKGEISAEYTAKLPYVTEYSDTKTENVFAIVVKNGTANVMGNYNITYEYGGLAISKRIIYIQTESFEKVYDGNTLYSVDGFADCYYYPLNDLSNPRVSGEENILVKGQRFTYQTISQTDAGYAINDNFADIFDVNGVSKAFNYDVRKPVLGRLTVHKREIYVDASSATQVYDGTTLYSPDENYTVSFYPENKLSNTPVTGEENVLVAGHVFKKIVPSAVNAGVYYNNPYARVLQGGSDVSDNYMIVSRTGRLTVEKRPVNYWVESLTMIYRNGSPLEDPAYRVQQEGEDGNMGLLLADAHEFTFGFDYFKPDGTEVERFNVGTYTIGLAPVNSAGRDNYIWIQVRAGTLIVEKAKLSLKPADKRELYVSASQQIVMTADDLIVVGLAEGDAVSAAFNRSVLKASDNKSSMSVKIVEDSIVVQDARTKKNVSGNYEITTSVGYMSFLVRTVYFEQIVPDSIEKTATGRGLLAYTGEKQNISGGNALFRVLSASEIDTEEKRANWSGVSSYKEDSYGLLSSDAAALKSAYVLKNPQINSQWVWLKVLDSSTGKEMSKMYHIVPVRRAGTENSIEVLPVQVKVDFSSKLTQGYVNGLGAGTTLLDASYIEKTEGLLSDNLLEAAINKSESGTVTLYLFIYQPRYDINGEIIKRTDKSMIYRVTATFAAGIDLNAKLVTTTAYYPTT